MYKLREVERGRYDDRGYSNEQSLAALMLQKPEEINNFLTYTYGMDDDRFPLTFLTEGQGAAGVRDILTKSLGSANVLNVVKATFNALEQLKSPEVLKSGLRLMPGRASCHQRPCSHRGWLQPC